MTSSFNRLSIRAQITLLVLAILLPAAVLVAYSIFDASKEARETAYSEVRALAVETAGKLDLVLRDNEALLARLAEQPQVRALDPHNCDPFIHEFVSLHPEYTTLSVRDRDANSVCSFFPRPLSTERVHEFPWFIEGVRSEKFTAGDAFLGRQSGRWLSVFTYPVRDPSGRVSGLLILPTDLRVLQERVLQSLPKDALVVVLDRENNFLMRSIDPSEWIGKALPVPQLDLVRGQHEGFIRATGVDGVRRLFAFTGATSSGWRVFAGVPEAKVFAAHRERLTRSVAVGIAILLLILILAYRISRAIARPIRELASTSATVAAGNMAARAPVSGPTEIQHVALQFNRMLDARARFEDELRASRERFDLAVRGSSDGIWDFNAQTNEYYFSERWCELLGYRTDELLPTFGTLAKFIHPDDRERALALMRPDLEHREPFAAEFRMRRKSGEYGWFLIRGQAIWNEQGKATRMAGSLTEITARKRAEQVREQLVRQLELFSERLTTAQEEERHRIAYELHEQLGQDLAALQFYLQAIGSSSAGVQTEKPRKEALSATVHATERVRRLVLDLEPPELDTFGLYSAVRTYCQQQAAAGGWKLYIHAPKADARPPRQMEKACFRVVQESLSNVLHHAKATEVWVRLQQDADELELVIRDNGIGFERNAPREDNMLEGGRIGLFGMQIRAKQVGGSVEIKSAVGAGTEVRALFPLPVTID